MPQQKTRKSAIRKFLSMLKRQIRKFRHKKEIKKCVSRVNYFLPCIPIDYQLLKSQCNYFYAEELPHLRRKVERLFVFHEIPGNILIGNSLTYTNNHLDVIDKIHSCRIDQNRKIILPVSYGWGNAFGGDPNELISQSGLNPDTTVWLTSYLDREVYFGLFNNVTHAVFGVLRQQALGNIFECLRKGVKVYLYKDSIVAKQLKDDGIIFYTIDEDLTEESLCSCLSKEEALHNFKVMKKMDIDTSEAVFRVLSGK